MSIVIYSFGGIAQLGERLNGIQEVSGSNPLISILYNRKVRLLYKKRSTRDAHSCVLYFASNAGHTWYESFASETLSYIFL